MSEIFDQYRRIFGSEATHEFTVYGRAELAGNHTDHQRGLVLAATISPAMHAAAEPNRTNTINVYAEGFGPINVNLEKRYPLQKEKGTPAALVRGMASKYDKVSGFNAFICSDIPIGAGLASSAAFEVIIGRIIEELFDCKTDNYTLAYNAQFAEDVFYNKPCGLMDQMTCAYGGIVKIDFGKPTPIVESIDYDFEANGYTLCIIDSGADHSQLTDYYSEITTELSKVSNYFFRDNLSQIDKKYFATQLGELRKYAGDRAVLRAMHVFNENFRVNEMAEHLKKGELDKYLDAVNRSGDSSWMLLQNVIPSGSISHQDLAFAITFTKFCLSGKGACRLMGGGFAGCLQAYVPNDMLPTFMVNIERTLGKGSVKTTHITNY